MKKNLDITKPYSEQNAVQSLGPLCYRGSTVAGRPPLDPLLQFFFSEDG